MGPSSRDRSSSAGAWARLCVPNTTSTWPARSTMRSRSFCARQPPTAIWRSGRRSLRLFSRPRWPYSLLSAFSRTQQVLSTTTSASSTSSVCSMPSAASNPAIRSESCSFIWHPNVRMWKRRGSVTGSVYGRGSRSRPQAAVHHLLDLGALGRARIVGVVNDDALLLYRRRPRERRPDPFLGPGGVGPAREEVDDRGEEQRRRLLEVDLCELESLLVEEVGSLVGRLRTEHLVAGFPGAVGESIRPRRDVARPGFARRRRAVAAAAATDQRQECDDHDHTRTPPHHDLPTDGPEQLAPRRPIRIQSTACPPSPSCARCVWSSADGGKRTGRRSRH